MPTETPIKQTIKPTTAKPAIVKAPEGGGLKAAIAAREQEQAAKYTSIPTMPMKAVKSEFWDSVLSNSDSLDPTAPPPDIELLSILVRGPKGTLKSTLPAGNPRAIILSPPDGRTVYPRMNACAIRVEHFAYDARLDAKVDRSFEGNLKRLTEAAYKEGPSGRYCMLWLDSIYEVVQWLMQRELVKLNENLEQRNQWGYESKGDAWRPFRMLTSVREDKEANTSIFPMLGEEIASWMRDIKGAGWGVGASMHLQLGYNFADKVVEDKPDIPGSTARALDKPADLILDCIRVGGTADTPVSFVIEPTSSRVPMEAFEVPNIRDMPPGLTVWDICRHEYNKGRSAWNTDQQKFVNARDKAPSTK